MPTAKTIHRSGKKGNGAQNHLCKACGRQFIRDDQRTYIGASPCVPSLIRTMPARGNGARDVAAILRISVRKVLKTLVSGKYTLKLKHYDRLEIDEFWTFAQSKKNRKWLVYAYHRETGEIVAYVWGKRDLKTAGRLKKRLEEFYYGIACDGWESFRSAFGDCALLIGKQHTQGIEGSNCRLRHRIKRAFRRSCNFSKKLLNHLKAFSLVFHFLNYGWV